MFDATVMIVEDELHMRRAMKRAALGAGKRVLEAETARQAIDVAAASGPDAVVLDLGLPDLDGIEVCREIRRWSDAPIIVLTARDSQRDKVRLLDLGADDYMTKPFDVDELSARIRVQLRRTFAQPNRTGQPVAGYGHLDIDFPGRTLRRNDREPGELVRLTRIEWEILASLVAASGRTVTHTMLRAKAWRVPGRGGLPELRMHVANLRRKIERDPVRPELIVTESGIGYRFEPPV